MNYPDKKYTPQELSDFPINFQRKYEASFEPIIHDNIMTHSFLSAVMEKVIPNLQWLRQPFTCREGAYTSSSLKKYGKNDNGQFVHSLFDFDYKTMQPLISEFWAAFTPIVYTIGAMHEKECRALIRAKLNYTCSTKTSQGHMMPHCDVDDRPSFIDPNKNYYSCVYYLSERNGDLLFFSGVKGLDESDKKEKDDDFVYDLKDMAVSKRISPNQNRGVFLDSRSFHAGSYSTNNDRICLNIVWEGS